MTVPITATARITAGATLLPAMVAVMNATRGGATRRTRSALATNVCEPAVNVVSTSVHADIPTSVNSTYGTGSVLTDVTPLKTSTRPASSPSGCRISHTGPSIDCLYFDFRS